MAKVTMQLEGFEALQRAIKTSPDLVRLHSEDAVSKTSFSTASRATALAPRGPTGRLKGSIKGTSRGLNGRVTIAPEAFYWRYVEYGTVNMTARPFIRPAAEAEGPHYINRMRAIGPKLERNWPTSSRFL